MGPTTAAVTNDLNCHRSNGSFHRKAFVLTLFYDGVIDIRFPLGTTQIQRVNKFLPMEGAESIGLFPITGPN